MLRRDVLRRGARLLMAGALLGATGYLLAAGKVSPQKECGDGHSCARCRKASECQKKNRDHGR